MLGANCIDNPSTITKQTKDEIESEPLDESVPYREASGSLQYAASLTELTLLMLSIRSVDKYQIQLHMTGSALNAFLDG